MLGLGLGLSLGSYRPSGGTPTPTGPLRILVVGSSTPQKYFDTYTGTSNARVTKSSDGTTFTAVGTTGQGGATLGNVLANALSRDIQFVTAGVSGTTLTLWEASPSTYRAAAVAAVAALGGVDLILSIVGFNDANVDKSVVSAAAHATKLRSFFTKLRTEIGLPGVPIFIGTSQKYTGGDATSAAQIVFVRNGELAVSADTNNRLYAHVYDLAQVDGIHMSNGEYTKHANRGAAQILAYLNSTTQIRGPAPVSAAAVDPTHTDVTFSYVAGTNFTPTSALTGFQISVDGFATTLAISGAVQQSANPPVVRLTHATTGASAVTAGVQYMATAEPDVSAVILANTSPTTPPDYTTAPLAFTTIPDVTAPNGIAWVNHNYAGNAAVGGSYNDWTIPAESAGVPSANTGLSKALNDTAGISTGWTLTIGSPFTGTSTAATTGATTGANTGIAPDAVLLSYWFEGDSPVTNPRRDPATITLSGLDPSKLYTLRFVGSRAGATARSTNYKVDGVNSKNATLVCNANTANAVTHTDMQPDAGGNLVLTVTAAGTAAFGYLNELRITQQP